MHKRGVIKYGRWQQGHNQKNISFQYWHFSLCMSLLIMDDLDLIICYAILHVHWTGLDKCPIKTIVKVIT